MKTMPKKVGFLILIFALLLAVTSCNKNKSDGIYDSIESQNERNESLAETPNSTPTKKTKNNEMAIKKELSGKLNIAAPVLDVFQGNEKRNPLISAAEAFMTLHPGVIINLDIVYTTTVDENMDKFRTQMATGLMTGTAPDIVDVGLLPYDRYSESGLLCNLYELMNSDPSFEYNDYYDNIFEAFSYNDGLYAVPHNVSFLVSTMYKDFVKATGVDFGAKDTVSFVEMFDIYDAYVKSNPSSEVVYMASGVSPFSMANENFNYLADYRNKKARFDEPWFTEYQSRIKAMPIPPSIKITPDRHIMIANADTIAFEKNAKIMFNVANMFFSPQVGAIRNIIAYDSGIFSYPVLHVEKDGKVRMSAAYDLLAITEQSNNKELAWEFVKFFLSYYDDEIITNIPINKSNAGLYIENAVKETIALLEQEGTQINDSFDEIAIRVTEIVDKYLSLCNAVWTFDTEMYYSLVYPELYDYVFDKKTLKEVTTSLQSKVTLHLNE